MSDRTLLELAAKAAGYAEPSGDDDIWRHVATGELHQWNPLTDDGDALRLAVRLYMNIQHNYIGAGVLVNNTSREKYIDHADELAATRYAIVRAAAEIAKRMGESK